MSARPVGDAALVGAVSAVMASLLTLAGLLLTTRWRIAEINVTQERAKWREEVRRLVVEAVTAEDDATIRKVWVELAVRMNPLDDHDRDDRELVDLVARLKPLPRGSGDSDAERVVALAANILKHDWERVKWKASLRFWEDEPEQPRLSKRDANVSQALPGPD